MAGDIRIKTVGLDRLTARLHGIAARLPEALGAELYRDMVGVMAKSQDIVPYDEGDLHDSGEVDRPEVDGSGARVVLHYGSASVPYALTQHENMEYAHPRGGEAKFLEKVLNAWTADGPEDVAARAIKRVARR